jgi:hypothetical protein
MIDLPAPLAVVCHDAGATNLILPWIAAGSPEPLLPVLEGPAAVLWHDRFGTGAITSVEQGVESAAAVLTGTGWASDLEHCARKLARQRAIRSVAVIDHWVNYRERFVRNGQEVLPDEIWVTDEYALRLAEAEFPNIPVRLQPNLYLAELVAKAPPLIATDRDVLFVAEPARSDWGRGTPGEFQALDYFLSRRDAVGIPVSAHIRLRPHPSEPPVKYDEFAKSHANLTVDRADDLASAFGGARWVIGCESYALIVALHSGRQAISALPPWAPQCRLPHREVVRLAEIEA